MFAVRTRPTFFPAALRPPATACLRGAAAALLAVALLALTPHTAAATFPGAPGPIAFQSTRAGGLSIWIVDAGGGGLRQVTLGGGGGRRPTLSQYSPSISPDGRRLAYVGAEERDGHTWRNLFVKPIGVRDPKRPGHPVLRRPTLRAINSLAFASNRRLVFSAVPAGGGDLELFSVGTNGHGRRQLTRNDIQDIEPAVSASGRIAFTQMLQHGRPERALFGRSNLALLIPGRGAPRRLTHGPNEDRDPDFAPSGRSLVYEHYSLTGSGAGRIAELTLSSKRPQTIFAGSRQETTFDDPHSPALSPSGTELVFDRTVSDEFGQISNPSLYAIGTDGSDLRTLLDSNGEYDTDPSWGVSPRG